MNIPSRVAVALIGGGTIAPLHAKYLVSSPSCELIAIIDPFSPGKELAESLSVNYYPTVAALLSSKSRVPEAYIICAPSSLHVPLAKEVLYLAAPKALLIEKPFSTTSSSGAELLHLAEDRACPIIVGHHRRFHPALAEAKEAVISGKLGDISALSGMWTAKKNDSYFSTAKWRSSRSGGGGPVWTNLVHDIDTLHFLIDSRIIQVTAIPTQRRRLHKDMKKDDLVEEGAAILLRFANGVVGTFLLCDNVASPFNWDNASGENPMYPKPDSAVHSCQIFGTEGTLTVPDNILWTYKTKIATKLDLEIGWHVPMGRADLHSGNEIPFQQQTEHLAKVVKGQYKPKCSGEDGLAAVKVCEAIMQSLSAGNGATVDIYHYETRHGHSKI